MATYLIEHIRSGLRREIQRPIDQRDDLPRGWRRVLDRGHGGVDAKHIDETDADRMIPKALKVMEQTKSARQIAKETGFSVDHLKRVWMTCILFLFALQVHGADINAGTTFQDGEHVTAALMNAIVGNATINPQFYTGKTAAAPDSSDIILFYSTGSGGFRKCTYNTFLIANASLITSQPLKSTPQGNDLLLIYDTTGMTLAQTTINDLLLTVTNNISGLPLATNINGDTLVPVYQGGTNASLTASNLFSLGYALSCFTNLPARLDLTNVDKLMIWDSLHGTNKQTTLVGLITNLPPATVLTTDSVFTVVTPSGQVQKATLNQFSNVITTIYPTIGTFLRLTNAIDVPLNGLWTNTTGARLAVTPHIQTIAANTGTQCQWFVTNLVTGDVAINYNVTTTFQNGIGSNSIGQTFYANPGDYFWMTNKSGVGSAVSLGRIIYTGL